MWGGEHFGRLKTSESHPTGPDWVPDPGSQLQLSVRAAPGRAQAPKSMPLSGQSWIEFLVSLFPISNPWALQDFGGVSQQMATVLYFIDFKRKK